MLSADNFSPTKFYREWIGRSLSASLVLTGVDNKREIMRNLLLWAIASLILFFIPWNYIPVIGVAAEDLSHEVRLGLSFVLAIIAVFVVSLAYQLLIQPAKMQNELWQRVGKTEAILSEIENVERDKVILSDLHRSGVGLYQSYVTPDDPDAPARWVSDMEAWLERVRDHIKDRWSISTLHEFNDPSRRGGFSYKRRDDGLKNAKTQHGGDATALYSGHIESLDHIIRFNGGDHFGQRRLFAARMKEDLLNSGAASSPSTGGLPDAPARR
jgi:hypothetical protein